MYFTSLRKVHACLKLNFKGKQCPLKNTDYNIPNAMSEAKTFFFHIFFCDLFRLDQVTVASLKGGTLIMGYDKKDLKPTSHGNCSCRQHIPRAQFVAGETWSI